MKSRLHHTENWTAAAWTRRRQCYRPAIFFRHPRLFQSRQNKMESVSKNVIFSISLHFFKCVSIKKNVMSEDALSRRKSVVNASFRIPSISLLNNHPNIRRNILSYGQRR